MERTIVLAALIALLFAAGAPCPGAEPPPAPPAASAADPKPLFEDKLREKLGPGWTWLREDPKAWRLTKEGLEIRVQPGVAENVKNALVRPAPDRRKGPYAIEVTITNHSKPTNQYEQAGITWYVDGKPKFKVVKELVNGKVLVVPAFKPMESDTVQLRIVLTADSWKAQFRPDAKGEFQDGGSGKLDPAGKEEVSIQCYQGPADAEHWIRFRDFRIVEAPAEKAGTK